MDDTHDTDAPLGAGRREDDSAAEGENPTAEPRWLSHDELTAWLRFMAVLELLPGSLDAQLARDAELTHFEYVTLAMLSEQPTRTLRMTALSQRANATLPRLSRVASGLERRGFVTRTTCSDDRRATNVTLTEAGWQKVLAAAPGHVEHVRRMIFDPLTTEQVESLSAVALAILHRLDPEGRMLAGSPAPEA